jgi:predicted RNase H-like nuclease (RuvC/YqgF family)
MSRVLDRHWDIREFLQITGAEASTLREFFFNLGQSLEQERISCGTLKTVAATLEARLHDEWVALEAALKQRDGQIETLRATLEHVRTAFAQELKARNEVMTREIDQLRDTLSCKATELARFETELQERNRTSRFSKNTKAEFCGKPYRHIADSKIEISRPAQRAGVSTIRLWLASRG